MRLSLLTFVELCDSVGTLVWKNNILTKVPRKLRSFDSRKEKEVGERSGKNRRKKWKE
jgi:hypothetical protein